MFLLYGEYDRNWRFCSVAFFSVIMNPMDRERNNYNSYAFIVYVYSKLRSE